MFWTSLILAALAIFFLLFYWYLKLFGDSLAIKERLNRYARKQEISYEPRKKELSLPLWNRICTPLFKKLRQNKQLPAAQHRQMSRKIRLAGNPWGITPYELKLIKYAAALLCGGTSLGTGYLLHLSNILNITLMPLMCYVGWLLPEIYLNARAKSRQNEVERSLPDVLDLLTVSIEAGLGFDAALLKVVEKSKGVLADELKEMINEVQMGKPRLEALRDMADRVGVEDLSSFVGAVVMAEQMGVRLGNVLRTQSDQIRLKRRQRAEEMAFKAPVKMLLPLVFLIFPATFIVLLGPAVIRIMSVFGG